MKAFLILAASVAIFSLNAAAKESQPTEDQVVGEGLMLILKGEKKRAWEVLFPEAQKGNVVAMYHLGSLMLRSPEYPDNLERAQQFFKAASQRGHKGSRALLTQVEATLSARANKAPASIAGVSGVPTTPEMASARQRVEKYAAEVLRYTGTVSQIEPKVTIKAFFEDGAAGTSNGYAVLESLKAQFPESIKLEYFALIDPATWQANKGVGQAISRIPTNGFLPDFSGQIAASHGVRNTPAFVLITPGGRSVVLTNPQDVINQIKRLL